MGTHIFDLYREKVSNKLYLVNTTTGETYHEFFGMWLVSGYSRRRIKERCVLIGKNLRKKN